MVNAAEILAPLNALLPKISENDIKDKLNGQRNHDKLLTQEAA